MNRKIRFGFAAIVGFVLAAVIVYASPGSAQAQSQQEFPTPHYVPPQPNQGAPQQTLTLPSVAPQGGSSPSSVRELGRQHAEPTDEVPPLSRQPQGAVARISITATDDAGRWIPDLRKDDFTIYEDGVERPVLGIQHDEDVPVSIGIVIDTSGSMSWKLPAAEAALEHFVNTLNPRDQVFMSAFSDRAYLLQDFTDNPTAITRSIALLHADGRTALYDAVVMALSKVEQGRWPKKALLVMTDGIDNVSAHSLDEVIASARRGGVLIYTVGLGTEGSGLGSVSLFGGAFSFGSGPPMHDDERVEAPTLRRLSDETGATNFIMNPRTTNMSALDTHFQRISRELRAQYSVRYASAGGSRLHQIRVEGARAGIRLRAPRWVGDTSGGDASGG